MSMLVIFRVIFSIKITFFQEKTIAMLYEIDVQSKLAKVQIRQNLLMSSLKKERGQCCVLPVAVLVRLTGTFGTFLEGLLEAICGQVVEAR